MTSSAPDTDTMTPAEFKTFENRLRRMAERQGLGLSKSRRRDPHAFDFGRYLLFNREHNFVVLGGGSDGGLVTAEYVYAWLTDDEGRPA